MIKHKSFCIKSMGKSELGLNLNWSVYIKGQIFIMRLTCQVQANHGTDMYLLKHLCLEDIILWNNNTLFKDDLLLIRLLSLIIH